jgi:hypothetical protein
MNWLRRHFERYRERSTWDFCWRIAVEGTLVSLVSAALLTVITGGDDRGLDDWGIGVFFLVAVLIAPVVETMLAQALPIFVVRKFGGSFRVQIIISAVLFAACHFPEGVVAGISAGVIGGFYFGFTYAHWREKSRWASFWVTATSHAIHNGIVVGLLAASAVALVVAASSDEPNLAPNPNVLAQFKIDKNAKEEILLPVELEGKEYLFDLDTGASITLFDISLRDKIREPKGTVKVRTPSGIFECELSDAPKALLGSLSLEGTIGVVDLEQISSARRRKRYGVIGMNFLKKHVVQMDFDKGVVSFLKSKPDRGIFSFLRPSKNKHPEWGEEISIRYDEYGVPHITAKAEGAKVDFMIDTGYVQFFGGTIDTDYVQFIGGIGGPDLPVSPSTGALESKAFKKIRSKIDFEVKSVRTIGKRTDTLDFSKQAVVSRFSVGALEYKDAIFRESDESVLGMPFLSRHFVTFDFPNGKIYLKKGKYFDRPTAVVLSLSNLGFTLRCRQNDIFVSEVDPNGPAYAKGMRQQDVVIRVDEVDVASYSLTQLFPLFSQKDKEGFTITVRRGNDIKQISFSLNRQDPPPNGTN